MSSATTNQPFVFTPGTSPVGAAGTDPLVHQTRREIAEIVREVAAAARSEMAADAFLALLVDRTLRAMAAEGVIVWRCTGDAGGSDTHNATYQCVRRLGKVTDGSIPIDSIATHNRLLVEVASEGQPVVVPATPGATDPQVPSNPMAVPVALVPIECERLRTEYLLEVFLEPDGGVATQRGYLRFVAQMADLAGEFLRADQLRTLRRTGRLASEVDIAIRRMHEMVRRNKLEPFIVDHAIELFGFDRVGLCALEPKIAVVAVSHVNTIDRKSPAARQLCKAATLDLDSDGCAWFEERSRNQPSRPAPMALATGAGESNAAPERSAASAVGADQHGHSVSTQSLVLRAVVAGSTTGQRRLVCMQVSDADPVSEQCRGELLRFMRHAELALRSATRLEAIPGGWFLASVAPAIQTHSGHRWRSVVMPLVLIALLVIAALVPVPLVVYSPGSVRPAIVQTLSAPRDAIVDRIHVRHGQKVSRGDKLLTLVDPALEEQITALLGRRAVLAQQRSRWTAALVDTASHHLDRLEQVQGERSIVAEEMQAIDDQLAVLKRAKEALLVRAGRDGIVDAWQIEQRLQSKTLRRGDPLLQVVAKQSSWLVDARVPQSRIAHLQDADADHTLSAQVSLEAKPHESFRASLQQIGPAVVADQDGFPSTAVLLRVSDEASSMLASQPNTSHQSGAPARIMFHCGTTPAAYLLFQDMIRSLQGTVSLYLAGNNDDSGEAS